MFECCFLKIIIINNKHRAKKVHNNLKIELLHQQAPRVRGSSFDKEKSIPQARKENLEKQTKMQPLDYSETPHPQYLPFIRDGRVILKKNLFILRIYITHFYKFKYFWPFYKISIIETIFYLGSHGGQNFLINYQPSHCYFDEISVKIFVDEWKEHLRKSIQSHSKHSVTLETIIFQLHLRFHLVKLRFLSFKAIFSIKGSSIFLESSVSSKLKEA